MAPRDTIQFFYIISQQIIDHLRMASSGTQNLLYVDESGPFSDEFAAAVVDRDGFTVEASTDLGEGLEVTDKERYDCVIVGEGVSWRRCLNDAHAEEFPVILLTNDHDGFSQGFEAGVEDCLPREHPALQAQTLCERLRHGRYSTGQTRRDQETKLETYERLLASDELILYTLDSAGTITMASQEFADRMGERQQQVIGSQVTEYISEPALEEGYELIGDLLTDSDSEWGSRELQIDHDDEEARWYRDFITPLSGKEGQTEGILGVMFDITDHRERLDELELYEMMIESIPEMVWAMDEYGNYRYVNHTYEDYGVDPEDLIGSNVAQFMKPDDLERIQKRISEIYHNENKDKFVDRHEYEAKGQRIKSEAHLALLESDSDELEGLVGISIDINNRVEREQRLNVVNRILRHNIRNALTVINGGVAVIADEATGRPAEQAALIEGKASELEVLSEKVKRVEDILTEQQTRELTDLVTPVNKVLRTRSESDVTFETDLPDQAEAYAIDGFEFAIENLVENAIKHNDRENLRVRVSLKEADDSVIVTVADNGTGIPEDEIAAIKQGEEEALVHASGIGLWAVNWIVNRSRGDLEVDDSELGGAAVRIRLSKQA
jgi:PAS domain S-box-containing protein